MSRVRFRPRWLVRGLFVAGYGLAGGGCADTAAERDVLVPPVVRLVQPPPPPPNSPGQVQALQTAWSPPPGCRGGPAVVPASFVAAPPRAMAPELLPPGVEKAPAPKPDKLPDAVVEEKAVPINLDSVLRLAEEQNGQIALAREKLHESEAEQCLAARAWLPQVYAGVGYFRHEGGIQNEDGSLTHSSMGSLFPGLDIHATVDLREVTFQRVSAERKAWQQRGELTKVTSETLLEAATTYTDLLTARRGAAVAVQLEKYLLDVQERVEKLVTDTDRSAQALVDAVRAEVSGRRQALARLRAQGDSASAKLAYLLGLPPDVKLVPVDEALAPVDLVDPNAPLAEMVERARFNGPGVRELWSLLGVLEEALDQAAGPGRLMPALQLGVGESWFGAGPGSRMSFDNRLDVCVSARWNLTEWLTAREKRRVAESKVMQVRLTYDDLRGKLTAGVREARDSSLSGRTEIAHAAETIKYAAESYRLSNQRWKDKVPNATPVEVINAIRGLEAAHTNYLTAVSAYNKAQLRLLVLLGPAECAVKPAGVKATNP